MTMTFPSSELHAERERRIDDQGRRIDFPLVSFDVPLELARLRTEHTYELEGHAGRTLIKYPDLRVVLEAMKSGIRLPLHQLPERLTLQVILGVLRVWLEQGDSFDVAEGSFAAVEAGRVQEIECLDECGFLLTLAWARPARPEGELESDGAGI